MSFTWSIKAFAHSVVNPPSMQSGCNVDLDLSNKTGVIQVSKGAVGPQTEYEVTIQDPKSLGVASFEQTTVYTASQDLILACDIVLQCVALSLVRVEPSKPNVMMVSPPTEVTVKHTDTGGIEVFGTARIRTELYITVGDQESLDESRAVQIFNKLAKLDRFNLDTTASTREATLTNALHEYEAAMASLDRLLTFKHLYNVLELVTNIDGTNKVGDDLDAQMALVTGAPKDKCGKWRDLYNRTKHINRNSGDVATFVSGLENLPQYIRIMRPASGKKLADLLASV